MRADTKWKLVGIVCLSLALPVNAAAPHHLTTDWVDGAGQRLVTIEIRSPEPITQAHLDAMEIKLVAGKSPTAEAAKGMNAATQRLSPRLVNEFELPAGNSAVVDWSGVRVSSTPQFVDSCFIWVYTFAGSVRKNEVFVYEAGPTMTITSALTRTGKTGDPDLYIYDPVTASPICSSTNRGSAAESCFALANFCENEFADVVVFGAGKNQRFALLVSETEAY